MPLNDKNLDDTYNSGWDSYPELSFHAAGLRAVAEAAVKDERENRNRPMALREFVELVQKLVIIGPLTSEQGRQLMMLQEMASTTLEAAVPDVDWLAQVIRAVDGKHDLGAGALAEKIVEAMRTASQPEVKS
jgi:hypothetical protein